MSTMLEKKTLPIITINDDSSDMSDSTTLSSYDDGADANRTSSESLQLLPQDTASPTVSSWKRGLVTMLYITINTVSTVAIIFLNKIVFVDQQLRHCQISIAAYHFLATFVVLILASACLPTSIRLFEPIRAPLRKILPLSAFFTFSIVSGNLSLAFNSVGFNQLTKILTMPTVVLLNFVLFRVTVSRARLIAVFICCLGVSMTNTKEAIANPIGSVIAIAAFTITALYQIWIGRQMKDLEISAPQLLLNQAPVSVVMLLCILPFVDTMPDISQVETKTLLAFIASGFAAAILNLSQFLIIGRSSALTFNVVGIAKILLILALAPLFAPTTFTVVEILGVGVAISGIWIYAQNNGTTAAQKNAEVDEEKGYAMVPAEYVEEEDDAVEMTENRKDVMSAR